MNFVPYFTLVFLFIAVWRQPMYCYSTRPINGMAMNFAHYFTLAFYSLPLSFSQPCYSNRPIKWEGNEFCALFYTCFLFIAIGLQPTEIWNLQNGFSLKLIQPVF